ncbi:MAG: CarD family transcriptional regulator [Tissierellia bacterium]|nr:CarD family transcriptional regulator [Tissierellia bacterium]
MFSIGDRIVYPMHGAGVIKDIEKIEILGDKKEYFVMKMPIGDMKVMVPVDSIEEVGVRQVVDEDAMPRVIKILRGSKTAMPQNWNRRYRANMDRIRSGDIFEIAAVVRNLMILDKEKGLSTGERKMLNSAKQMLVSEMVLVCSMEVEETESLIAESVEIFDEEDSVDEEEVTEEFTNGEKENSTTI